MRWLLAVACLVLGFNSYAKDDYIRVTGEASTLAKAKEAAFREAIQIKVGAVVVSEAEAVTNKIARDDVSLYSAGYINDFKIIAINNTSSSVTVTMDVLVADSKLVRQQLATGNSIKQIDGVTASTRYETYMDQKASGDKVLNSVLNTYPHRAYNINQKPFRLVVDSYRNAVIEIPFKLSWNYDYIVALNEAMEQVQDSKFGLLQVAPANVIIMAKDPKDFLFGKKSHYKINDILLMDRIKDSMTGSRELRIKVTLKGFNQQVLHSSCWVPGTVMGYSPAFYSVGAQRSVVFFGNQVEENTVQINIAPSHSQMINDLVNIELSVVALSLC